MTGKRELSIAPFARYYGQATGKPLTISPADLGVLAWAMQAKPGPGSVVVTANPAADYWPILYRYFAEARDNPMPLNSDPQDAS